MANYSRNKAEFERIKNTVGVCHGNDEACRIDAAVRIIKHVMTHPFLSTAIFKINFWHQTTGEELSKLVQGKDILSTLSGYEDYSFDLELAELN